MSAPLASLTPAVIDEFVADHVFGTASSPDLDERVARSSVGIELEWLTSYLAHERRPSLDQVRALVADLSPLPQGGRLTIEPGGQLELSSARFDSLDEAIVGTEIDLFALDRECAERRIDLIALGADPLRPPTRILDAPRYDAMEAFFDTDGRFGRTMMCNTASVQINVGLGEPADLDDRWRLANALGPTLSACFANSPFSDGHPSGWQSTRLHAWWHLDPTRATAPGADRNPARCWTEFALQARVMLIHTADGATHPVTDGLTFGRWMVEGHELGWPTLDDFRYHLTTLFPPVRPRGWFEVRYIDALPTPFWHVAAAVIATILDDPAVRAEAWRAIDGTTDLWIDAAQLGLGHPALGASGKAVFAIALEALQQHRADRGYTDAVGTYVERWVSRGRTPADDRLDAWRHDGTLFPRRESPVPFLPQLVGEREAR
jgi:glutamate--cysteine ligase